MATDYDTACKEAATEQGLDGIVAHLRAVGYDVKVDQTGGFCMVARIDNECNDGWYGITNEGDADGDDFVVYFYASDEDTEGRSLAEDARTRESWSLELCADVSDRLLAEYVPPSIRSVIRSRDDVAAFFRGLMKGGVNFHPDTSANDYTSALSPAYDAAIRQCFEVADDEGFDVYEVAVEAAKCECGGCDGHGYDAGRCTDTAIGRMWSLERQGLIFIVCAACLTDCTSEETGEGQWTDSEEDHNDAWRSLYGTPS